MDQKESKKKRKKQSYSKKITALTFLGLLLVFGIMSLVSMGHKEHKPQASAIGMLNGRFAEEYEQYFKENFSGKGIFKALNHSVDKILGKRESNGVYQGKKHYLAEKIQTMDEKSVEKNVKAIQEFQDLYYNIPGYFMLVPNAANIQKDKLPAAAVPKDQSEQFIKIRKKLGESVTWVDAETALKEHKNEEIYYHTDEHWTTLGAFYGYEALTTSMNLDKGQLPKMKPYVVTNDFNGSLAKKSGYEKGYEESIRIYSTKNVKDNTRFVMTNADTKKKSATLYDTLKLEESDKYGLFPGYKSGLTDIETTVDTTERLLLFKDSYANCMLPFLVSHFREIVVIDPEYYKGNVQEIMQNKKFTRILYLYSGNSFVTDEKLNTVLK